MKKYNVIITPDAENNLNELDDYITFHLMAPYTAITYMKSIQKYIYKMLSIKKGIYQNFFLNCTPILEN